MGVISKTFVNDVEAYDDIELIYYDNLNSDYNNYDLKNTKQIIDTILEVTEVAEATTSNFGLVILSLLFFGTVLVVGIVIIKLCTRNTSGKYAVNSTMTRRFAAQNPVFGICSPHGTPQYGSQYSLHPATLDRPNRENKCEKVFACKYYKIEGDSIQ
jgi:hypothetical protein